MYLPEHILSSQWSIVHKYIDSCIARWFSGIFNTSRPSTIPVTWSFINFSYAICMFLPSKNIFLHMPVCQEADVLTNQGTALLLKLHCCPVIGWKIIRRSDDTTGKRKEESKIKVLSFISSSWFHSAVKCKISFENMTMNAYSFFFLSRKKY